MVKDISEIVSLIHDQKILVGISVTLFLAASLIYSLQSVTEHTETALSYPEDYPEGYLASDESVYKLSPGKELERDTRISWLPRKLKVYNNNLWVSSDNGHGTDISGVSHKDTSRFDLEGEVINFELIDENIFLLNRTDHRENSHHREEHGHEHHNGHRHHEDEQEHSHQETDLVVTDLDGNILKHYSVEKAYKLKDVKNRVFVLGESGEVVQLDTESFETVESWDVGKWIGDVEYDETNEELYFALTRKEKRHLGEVTDSEVENGYLSTYNLDGEEISRTYLGHETYPSDLESYGNKILAVERTEAKIYLKNTETGQTETMDISDHFHSIYVKTVGDYLYIADLVHNSMYQIDVEEREITNKIGLPETTSVYLEG